MFHFSQRSLTRVTVAAACLLFTSSSLAIAKDETKTEKETSVLIAPQNEPAIEGPAIPTLQNRPKLPPPARPNSIQPAKPRTTTVRKQPFMRPAEPKRPASVRGELTANELTTYEEAIPTPAAPVSAEIEIRPAPPIKYDTDGDARRMLRAHGEIDVVMVAKNPADGCHYEIPMCVPACCVGEPKVSGGRGIFGRGIVEFRWACGFRAEVKFRHILGDVKVEYEGD